MIYLKKKIWVNPPVKKVDSFIKYVDLFMTQTHLCQTLIPQQL